MKCAGLKRYMAYINQWQILLALCLLLAFCVRLANITRESIWWDEFATVAFLDPPSAYVSSPYYDRWNQVVIRHPSKTLNDFLQQNRGLDPAAMPLYLVIEYYWNRYVHPSPLALRVLSLLIGMAALPILFLFGKKLFGIQAGLIALFCMAMSPIHVQFSREIRMYGLMTLLAIIVAYTFYRLVTERNLRWWLVYAFSVALLAWTHPFALLLPFTQGIFWMCILIPAEWFTSTQEERRFAIKRFLTWGFLTALMIFPAFVWVLSIQFWGQESTESWMRVPTAAELINDIFADDAIGATYQINASPKLLNRIVGPHVAAYLLSLRWKIGAIFLLVVVFAMGGLCVSAIVRVSKKERGDVPTLAVSWAWNIFLILWVIVPPVVLYVLSSVWRPCHQPRYTLHSSLALYLILGGAIVALPKRVVWRAAIGLLVLFYVYQQALMLGDPQHPDWLGASRMLKHRAKPDDLILAHNWLWKRVFAYNLGPVPNVVCYGSQFDILAEKSHFFLDLNVSSRSGEGSRRCVWVVVQTDYFTRGTIPELEYELESRGMTFEVWEFPGIQRVILYKVVPGENFGKYISRLASESEGPKEFCDLSMEFWRAQEYEIAIAAAQAALNIHPWYARAWSYAGMAYKELNEREKALAAFAKAIELDPADYPWSLNNYAELLIASGQNEVALQISQQALDLLPGDGWSYALLGRVYYNLGDLDKAEMMLEKAQATSCQDIRIGQWLEEVKKKRAGEMANE